MPPFSSATVVFTLIADKYLAQYLYDPSKEQWLPYVIMDGVTIRTHPDNYQFVLAGLKDLRVNLREEEKS